MKNKQKYQGFTLMEILIVIGIIALLLGIAGPFFKRMKNQAHAVACSAQLRQIGVAISAYTGDNGLRFPTMVAARESREDIEEPVMDTLLRDYVRDESVFRCPADHDGFFEKTGSSYFWNSLVNGQMIGSMNLLGLSSSEAGIPLVSDKENFHQHIGHEVNILYADGHIHKELQFIVNIK